MLKVLINAYAICPEMGSEPGMAWNWCVNLAKYCELFIITEGEFKSKTESVVQTLPQCKNIHFFYNPVPDRIRRICWNQGDWRFYWYYKKWQKKTLKIARAICKEERIDIIHQLNMIGFREPGFLWKIEEIPFVWGPIGGLKQFPIKYLEGANMKLRLFNRLKNTINTFQIKYSRRVGKAVKRADLLISSIPDSYRALKKYKGVESIIITETGCFDISNNMPFPKRKENNGLRLLWVGKFDFRKQLEIALMSLAELKRYTNIRLIVCGTGSDIQVRKYHKLAEKLKVEKFVEWKGQISNLQIHEEMRKADLFYFTSVSEDTSTVVLEAISNCLPVLCHDACGFGYVINEKVGIKIPLTTPRQSAVEFAKIIESILMHKSVLLEYAHNCIEHTQKLSWDYKAFQMLQLYKETQLKFKEKIFI